MRVRLYRRDGLDALPQYCVGAGCRIFWSSICLTGVGTYLFDQDLLIRVVSILPARDVADMVDIKSGRDVLPVAPVTGAFHLLA